MTPPRARRTSRTGPAGAIVFDGRVLGAGPVTGVGRAFLATLAAYARTAGRRLVLVLPVRADVEAPAGVEVLRAPARSGAAHRSMLAALLRSERALLLHSPVAALPRRAPCPMVATVHDLPWMAPRPFAEPGRGLRHRLALRRALRVAAAIVVPSAATRDDLLRHAGDGAAARVRVIPHGVETPREPADTAALRGPFLVLGDGRERKNLARVREAWRRARSLDASLPDLRIVGPVHGYLDEEDKLATLRSARAVLHVSLFEGFGLPVVEAFAHGVPVVCSTAGSLPEVAAGAALLVDPLDVDRIANALLRIHHDDALRRDLRARGLARARRLTPRATSHAWHELHEELAP